MSFVAVGLRDPGAERVDGRQHGVADEPDRGMDGQEGCCPRGTAVVVVDGARDLG